MNKKVQNIFHGTLLLILELFHLSSFSSFFASMGEMGMWLTCQEFKSGLKRSKCHSHADM